MFSVHKSIGGAPGVAVCCACRFTSGLVDEIAVVRGRWLEVYQVDVSRLPALYCVGRWRLYGDVGGIAPATLPFLHDGRVGLLLAIREARLSLVEYIPASNTIQTVSLHSFERQEYKQVCLSPPPSVVLRAEPTSKCAVMLFYEDKLAVLPFAQRDVFADDDDKHLNAIPFRPSFVISLGSLQTPLSNIKDVVFLNGYFEPTLAVLYETDPTWAGLLHERKDTCRVAFLTLDITQNKNHPILFTSACLPHTASMLVAVPTPFGGVLVTTNTSIIYINQNSSSGTGVALNSYATVESAYIYNQDLSVMGLSPYGSRFYFLSATKLLMSTNTGNLWLIELLRETGTQVTGFSFEMMCESVVASCFITLTESLFFMSSNVSDSLLVEWLSADSEAARKVNALDPTSQDAADPFTDDITSMWTDDAKTLIRIGQSITIDSTNDYFHVVDALFTIAAVTDSTLGAVKLDNQNDIGLIVTSGYDKTAALTIVTQRIQPKILNRFELKGWSRMWTVCTTQSPKADSIVYDNYLILSNDKRTMVFVTGEEMQELDNLGFVLDTPTLEVCTIGPFNHIVQVLPKLVRVLDAEAKLLQEIPVGGEGTNAYIISARACNNYLSLMYNGGKLALMTLDPTTRILSLLDYQAPVDVCVTAVALYTDTRSSFPTYEEVSRHVQAMTTLQQQKGALSSRKRRKVSSQEYDDIDLDLYGADDDADDLNHNKKDGIENDDKPMEQEPVPTHSTTPQISTEHRTLAFLCWDNGSLEILLLPSLKRVFYCHNFAQLMSNVQHIDEEILTNPIHMVCEINVAQVCFDRPDAYILIRTSTTDIVLYKVMTLSTQESDKTNIVSDQDAKRLSVYLSRVENDFVTHRPVGQKKQSSYAKAKKRLSCFNNVSGYAGVFFANGKRSAWFMISAQGKVACIPADGSEIMSFATFHNVNCPHGFLLLTSAGLLCMATLPEGYCYDGGLPMRRVPMQRTCRRVTYDPTTSTYALVTSQSSKYTLIVEIPDQQEHHAPPGVEAMAYQLSNLEKQAQEPRLSGAYLPRSEMHELELISSVTFECIDRYSLEEHECVLAVSTVELECKQVASGRKNFLAVGTGFVKGEDVTTKGKIYIFDIIEVVPEPDKPQTNHRLKLLTFEEVKGPVSALVGIHGHLLAATGQKVIAYDLEDMGALMGIAFLDVNIYITTMCVLKSFVILGDAYKSVWFVGFQEDPSKLLLLGKDYLPLQVGSADFLVDETIAHMVVSDERDALYFMSYSPYNIHSLGGNKLLRRGDFHLGARVSKFVRLRMAAAVDDLDNINTTKLFVMYVTIDGSIGVVCPAAEKVYRRLLLLYNKIVLAVAQPAALNPRAYRHDVPEARMFSNNSQTMLDMDLLYDFLQLPHVAQEDLVQRIGNTVDRVYNDLRVLQEGWQVL